MPTITSCLWFDTRASEAADFYLSIFPNSRITNVLHYGPGSRRPEGSVLLVEFELDGRPFSALNGGPEFTFSEAVSFQIDCPTQEDVDRYWAALIAGGGQEGQCGWLKDKFGVSWQVVPREIGSLLGDPDPAKAAAATQAMFAMRRIDVAAIREAMRRA